jgi:hypothetical protein
MVETLIDKVITRDVALFKEYQYVEFKDLTASPMMGYKVNFRLDF